MCKLIQVLVAAAIRLETSFATATWEVLSSAKICNFIYLWDLRAVSKSDSVVSIHYEYTAFALITVSFNP